MAGEFINISGVFDIVACASRSVKERETGAVLEEVAGDEAVESGTIRSLLLLIHTYYYIRERKK
jgi:hypothetical protein